MNIWFLLMIWRVRAIGGFSDLGIGEASITWSGSKEMLIVSLAITPQNLQRRHCKVGNSWATWCQLYSGIHLHSWAGFLNLGTMGILSYIILCSSDCSVRCRMFSNTPGLTLCACSIPPSPVFDKQKCLLTLPNVPWGKIAPQMEPLL